MSILHILRGIGGEFELNRVLGAAGVASYIITAPTLVAYEVVIKGAPFDIVAFCAAYPTGLGVAIAAIAGAVAIKDKSVEQARATKAATEAAQ